MCLLCNKGYMILKKSIVLLGMILTLLFVSSDFAYSSEQMDKYKLITEIGTLSNTGQYGTALEKCTNALKKYPKEAELYYWSASIKSHLGDNKSAIKDYTEAIKINPKDSNAFVMRGISKTELNDYEGAIADYNHAIMLNPKDVSAYSMRACAKLEIGDMEGASKDLEKANKIYEEGEK